MRRLPAVNPVNHWEKLSVAYDAGEVPELGLTLYEDQSRSIVSVNDSPDLDFRFSVNPYRGCAHGCAYCYARPSHEFLGFGSGADFERRILVKPRAPELLRERFDAPGWSGGLIVFSGNTDCYQPVEARFELTRRCLAICAEYKNPVHIITKGALIERDLDILAALREHSSVGVSLSIPFWSEETARALEPYAPTPARRIQTIRRLSQAGIPVVLHVAPLIPGLSERGLGELMAAARDAGAGSAVSVPLRLPGSVGEVFEQRLREHVPLAADKILTRTRDMRGGKLNDSRFFARFAGQGEYAQAAGRLFEATRERLGFGAFPEPRRGTFQRPYDRGGQLRLFRDHPKG